MTLDEILTLTVRNIKQSMPEAIYQGSLVKLVRSFDPRRSEYVSTVEQTTPAEIIFDNIEEDIRSGSTITATTVKLIIIADNIKDIDFYDYIQIGDSRYQMTKKIDINVGEHKALYTIFCEKQ
jgi:hypothetical protein